MLTKEQCLLKEVFNEIEYGRNSRLIQQVLATYNQGKRYASDMIFQNDERGLDQGLEGYSPSFIVYSIIGDDSEYDVQDPFFIIKNGIQSIGGYDFERMLTPEDYQKLSRMEIFEELDNTNITDAFDSFVEENYPQIYRNIDTDVLYDLGYRTEYDMLNADWNKLVQEIQQYGQQQQINESRTVKLNESDLRKMVNKALKKILK